MKSSNPTYSRDAIARLSAAHVSDGTVLTLPGIARKSLVLLALVIVSAGYTWRMAALKGPEAVMGAALIGIIGGLIVAIFTMFSPTSARITAPIYAVLEGVGIGAISYIVNARYHGVPLQAAIATFGITAVCFGLFATNRIEVSESFAEKVAIGMMGLLAVYLLRFVLSLMGVPIGAVLDQGVFGFAINAISIGLAISCLFVDFAEIESARKEKLSAQTEWYFAFSVIVTLIWLYIAMLRMLRRFRR
ncbi:MAG: Bax inhibitor-1/YccA family protein [Gemmatimonadaceae bacterium]